MAPSAVVRGRKLLVSKMVSPRNHWRKDFPLRNTFHFLLVTLVKWDFLTVISLVITRGFLTFPKESQDM
jgi:hypothetical protein